MQPYTITHNSQVSRTIREHAEARRVRIISIIVLSLLLAAGIAGKAAMQPNCSDIPHTQANAELLATCKN